MSILIHDTTLRDGSQTPGVHFRREDKLEIARLLSNAGVDIIEAGFPFSSKEEFEGVSAIASELHDYRIAAFARGRTTDIDAALQSLSQCTNKRLSIATPTSDIHIRDQLKCTRDDALSLTKESLSYARSHCNDVEWIAIDAFRSNYDYLIQQITTAIKAGADTVTLADSVGIATPYHVKKLVTKIAKTLSECFPAVNLGVHFHNDLGLATANSLESVLCGVTEVHVTINGLGERAGNSSFEELVSVLAIHSACFEKNYLSDSLKVNAISLLSSTVARASRQDISPQKPIIGSNAYRHASGMHQDAMIKSPNTYQGFQPDMFGFSSFSLPISKQSGRSAIRERLKELCIEASEQDVELIFKKIRLVDTEDGLINAEMFEQIARSVIQYY